jgi:hypothetical protein
MVFVLHKTLLNPFTYGSPFFVGVGKSDNIAFRKKLDSHFGSDTLGAAYRHLLLIDLAINVSYEIFDCHNYGVGADSLRGEKSEDRSEENEASS